VTAAFPLNDAHRFGPPAATFRRLAVRNHKPRYEKYWPGLPRDTSLWTEEDHECFFAGLLEMEREERERAGLIGRWPIWEARQWAILHPEAAAKLRGALVLGAGVILGLLGPILVPWIVWVFQVIAVVCRFMAGG
jgi:hypothetical protein